MKFLIPLFNGFEDAEAFSIFSIFSKHGIGFEIAGAPGTTVQSASGVRVFAERRIDQVSADDYIGIILVSLEPQNYAKSSKLNEIVKKLYAQGKVIVAIGLAPLYLSKLGLLDDKRAVVAEGHEREIAYPRSEPVVVDGNIVTAKSFAAIPELCVKLANLVFGQEKAMEIRRFVNKL